MLCISCKHRRRAPQRRAGHLSGTGKDPLVGPSTGGPPGYIFTMCTGCIADRASLRAAMASVADLMGIWIPDQMAIVADLMGIWIPDQMAC